MIKIINNGGIIQYLKEDVDAYNLIQRFEIADPKIDTLLKNNDGFTPTLAII